MDSSPSGRRIYINHLEFSASIYSFSTVYLLLYEITYLYKYGLAAIYFMFWVVYYFIMLLIIPALATGASFGWLL